MTGAVVMMLGAGPPLITLASSYNITSSFFGNAFASQAFESDGDTTGTTLEGGSFDNGDWIQPKAAAPGAYEIRATLNSGTSPDGSLLNTWHALSSDRNWSLTQTGAGSKTCNLTVEIRLGTTILDTCTVVLTATAS